MGCSTTLGGLWDRRQGDLWTWVWVGDDAESLTDMAAWSSPLVEIRRGETASDPLVASTTDGSILLTGTDLENGQLGWVVLPAVSSLIAPGRTWLEVEVFVDGADTPLTIIHEELRVLPQVAVRP